MPLSIIVPALILVAIVIVVGGVVKRRRATKQPTDWAYGEDTVG